MARFRLTVHSDSEGVVAESVGYRRIVVASQIVSQRARPSRGARQ